MHDDFRTKDVSLSTHHSTHSPENQMRPDDDGVGYVEKDLVGDSPMRRSKKIEKENPKCGRFGEEDV